MITELRKMLDDTVFLNLLNAINENKDYEYSHNGLKIQSKSSDDQLSIQISYEPNTEIEDFEKYLESIDDEIFEGTCELMGQDNIARISNCLKSNDIESVRAGILKFKHYLKQYLTNKINYYKECWNTLLK